MSNSKLNINFILATSDDNVIGLNNQIPWFISEDLKRFKSLTTDNSDLDSDSDLNVLIMGFKTFESIGCIPLPNRLNIVLTSRYEQMKNSNNLLFLSNLSNAIYYCELNKSVKNIWIIGGKQLFEAIATIKPDKVYLTRVHKLICNETNTNTDENNIVKLSDDFFSYLKSNYLIQNNSIAIVTDKSNFTEISVDYYDCVREDCFEDENICSNSVKSSIPANGEHQYLDLLRSVITNGDFRSTRNDFTWSDFGAQLHFDLADGFPLLTSKKVPLKIIFEELMFFIRGYTDNKLLKEKNIHIWDSNTTDEFIKNNSKTYENSDCILQPDDMGPMYGFQWRHFNVNYDRVSNPDSSAYYKSKSKFDQLEKVLDELKTDPFSRRIIMTTFNPSQVSNGVLYPCHSVIIQFYAKSDPVNSKNLYLSIKMYQRSADLFLGLPFNIASTALLLYLICDYLNLTNDKFKYTPSKVILTLGDTHIYQSHLNAVLTQLQESTYKFPTLKINHQSDKPINSIEDYDWSNIELENYKADKLIKAKMVP
jgi:dihydrofolate reductase / thymidylate synthase